MIHVGDITKLNGEADFAKPLKRTGRRYPELVDFLVRYRAESQELQE